MAYRKDKYMKRIIGVRFKRLGKIYFFDPKWLEVKKGENVVVETAQGEEIAEVVIPNRMIDEEKLANPLKKVLRLASTRDLKHAEDCRKKEKEAFELCNKKIKEHKLEMTLTDVEYKFDNSKILFYFTADGRIDFRDLVKDLAAVYKTRIELRQIGVRDEVKRIGGNGVCGRELCCCSFLNDFETVSIKMAKEQNISLNPSKISGNCGRLMCCLKYEQEAYEEKLKKLPNIGAIVKTPEGQGEVDGVETLKEIVKVKIKDGEIYKFKRFETKDIKVIKDVTREKTAEEEKEFQKELKELENLERKDSKLKEN
jgi:cell fate regulator YaaT (PSP1 superfamily)